MTDLIDTFPIDLDHVFLVPAIPTARGVVRPRDPRASSAPEQPRSSSGGTG